MFLPYLLNKTSCVKIFPYMKQVDKQYSRNPDVKFLYFATIGVFVLVIGMVLAFILPLVIEANKPKPVKGREVSPMDITDHTSMDLDGSVTFTYSDIETGVEEEMKFSTTAPNYEIGAFGDPKYIYSVSGTSEYIIDIEYTVTGVEYSSMSMEVTKSNKLGEEQEVIGDTSVYSAITNGIKCKLIIDSGEFTIYKVVVKYTVK